MFSKLWRRLFPVTTYRAGRVRYLYMQDGAVERQLKRALIELFQGRSEVTRAYLVRTELVDSHENNVCLVLVGEQRRELVRRIAEILAAQGFASNEHLDIVWVDDEQEVAAVARPFYDDE